MESRKDQLQKQIKEALEANDNDLYSLLKSQWAHRFGVESLEELKNLDLIIANQNPSNEDNQEKDQSKDKIPEFSNEITIKKDSNKEKEISNKANLNSKLIDVDDKKSYGTKSYEINNKKNDVENSSREYRIPPKIQKLIPLPPKPDYGYLKKWIL